MYFTQMEGLDGCTKLKFLSPLDLYYNFIILETMLEDGYIVI